MSKASQRRRELENLGYADGYKGKPFRYENTNAPMVRHYKRGYSRGKKHRKDRVRAHIPIDGYFEL